MPNTSICISRNLFKISALVLRNVSKSFTTSCTRRKIFEIKNTKDFESMVLKSDLPVVIEFYFSWYVLSRMHAPRLEDVINKFSEKVHLAKVDCDENIEIARNHEVKTLPHVLGYRNGQPQKSFSGLREDDQIESFVKELIE